MCKFDADFESERKRGYIVGRLRRELIINKSYIRAPLPCEHVSSTHTDVTP